MYHFQGILQRDCRIIQYNTYQRLLADMKVEEVLSDAQGVCTLHAPLFQHMGAVIDMSSCVPSSYSSKIHPGGVDIMSTPFSSTIIWIWQTVGSQSHLLMFYTYQPS